MVSPKCRHKHIRKAVCQNYITGFCPKGPDCSFGHPKYELPNLNADEDGQGGGPGTGSGGNYGSHNRNMKDIVCYK
ncbi:Cleavage and polyadenylation specificity factor subunit 4, partial [Blyttiomyces sp. JEL0837]